MMAARPCEGVSRIDYAAEAGFQRRHQALLESGKLTTPRVPPNPAQQTVIVVMRRRRRRSGPKDYDRSAGKHGKGHLTHHFFLELKVTTQEGRMFLVEASPAQLTKFP
jgi:hypothetical protein